MPSRSDISGRNPKLIYTCNCGWIDTGHAFARSNTPYLGADGLWRQFPLSFCRLDAKFRGGSFGIPKPHGNINFPQTVIQKSQRDGKARFPDGKTGFVVHYTQDMRKNVLGGVAQLRRAVENHYLVKHGLSELEYKRIALSIFMEVSTEFETLQASFPQNLVMDSGFSQEDLVSNLIGFYVAIGEMTKDEALSLCVPVSPDTALQIWDSYGPIGQNKNREFAPHLNQSTYIDDQVNKLCKDECAAQPRKFPSAFQRIKPAPYGKNFLRFGDVLQ